MMAEGCGSWFVVADRSVPMFIMCARFVRGNVLAQYPE